MLNTNWQSSGTWYPSISLKLARGTAAVSSHPLPARMNALLNSWTRYKNLSLSENEPPLSAAPGYSQSKSNPSKSYFFKKSEKQTKERC